MKNWVFRDAENCNVDHDAAMQSMADELGISALLLKILNLRGLVDMKDLQDFLSPNLRLLSLPELWPGVSDCANIIVELLKSGKKIAVWGDYDADGITSTCLVKDVLAAHGFHVQTHIPERSVEGYGLNTQSIDMLANDGVEAILTVDCGISDVESIAYAKKLGLKVIISDHHLPPDILPDADGICNPLLDDCPCSYLAGVGVAFFLMCAVNSKLQEITHKKFDMRQVLDLVALGTLADVVLLQGQNRILVKNGLLKITEASRPGIAALKQVCNYDMTAKVNVGQVVFTLAPRINAAGRMGSAKLALELLLAKDLDTAMVFARKLDALNAERRKKEESVHEQAREQAKEQAHKAGLVLYAAHWHPGIIGIVASRIVDEFYRPTLILCDGSKGIKGSGRSISVFHLHDGLSKISDIFTAYGGHKLAAGLSIEASNLDKLRRRFDEVVRESLGDTLPKPKITIDTSLDFSAASNAIFLKELELLQPFGMGNAQPVFASPPLLVQKVRSFGMQKNHVILEVLDESTGISLRAKAWRKADEYNMDLCNKYIKLAYTPVFNTFNNVTSIELHIKDMLILTEQNS